MYSFGPVLRVLEKHSEKLFLKKQFVIKKSTKTVFAVRGGGESERNGPVCN